MKTDTIDIAPDEFDDLLVLLSPQSMSLETIPFDEQIPSVSAPQHIPIQDLVRSVARRRLDRELYALDTTERRKRHTLVGFMLSLAVLALLLWMLNLLDITPYVRQPERVSIPIQLLQFGTGNPNLPSAGNLTAEGAVRKAPQNPEPLEDARKTTLKREETVTVKPRDYTQPAFVKPVKEDAKTSEKADKLAANAAKTDVGSSTAPTEANGEGLGRFGSGAGRGQGYSLDWGGGGNRVVLHKELPKYPAGITTSAQIKMRFTVLPNGSVGLILPMQKGEPALERAAMEALRRWQFNPLNDGKEMMGFITFTFRIQ